MCGIIGLVLTLVILRSRCPIGFIFKTIILCLSTVWTIIMIRSGVSHIWRLPKGIESRR